MRSRTALIQEVSTDEDILYIGLDLGRRRWKMSLNDGGQKIKSKWVKPRNWEEFEEYIRWAADYFELDGSFSVVSCYEAGQDAFWPHRWLSKQGLLNLVVDPGSLREPKNGRRAKTDRTDAERLVRDLSRWWDGDVDVFNRVAIPDPEDEDIRRMYRERQRLLKEKNGHLSRMRQLLQTQGLTEPPAFEGVEFVDWLDEAETPDGRRLGANLKAELRREQKRLQLAELQLEELKEQRNAYLSGGGDAETIEKVRRLTALRGIGVKTAWALVVEMYGWREFQNRREVGAYVGLDGQRHDSGGRDSDQGITGKGNNRLRRLSTQMARNWLRWQPESYLAEWARENHSDGDGGVTQCGIIALARKLLNRLRIVAHGGDMPWGAEWDLPDI